MNFQKIIIYFSFLFMVESAQASICVNSTSNYKMFGSVLRSDVLNNPFLIAFKEKKFSDYKIYHADNDAQLTDQILLMMKSGCSLVLGLFTSQDCLVSGGILKKNDVIGFSSSCSDGHIAKFFPNIYTAVPKLDDFSSAIASHVNGNRSKNIYVFYQPTDIYSDSGLIAFKENINKPIITIPVDSNGNFELSIINKIKFEKNSTIVFFTYPLPSAQILVTLDSNNLLSKQVNIIGASSWIFDVSVFRPIFASLNKVESVLTPSLLRQNAVDFSKFTAKFKKIYGRPPDLVEILTYDITRLSVDCYRYAIKSGGYDSQLFRLCLKKVKFHGVSGKIKFKNNSPFPERKVYLINFMGRIT